MKFGGSVAAKELMVPPYFGFSVEALGAGGGQVAIAGAVAAGVVVFGTLVIGVVVVAAVGKEVAAG